MTTQQKQQYLRQEIVDKGYDPEAFVTFYEKYTHSDIQLENVTFEQLQLIVSIFLEDNKPTIVIPPIKNQPPQEVVMSIDDEFDDYVNGNVETPQLHVPIQPTTHPVDFDWSFLFVGGPKKEQPHLFKPPPKQELPKPAPIPVKSAKLIDIIEMPVVKPTTTSAITNLYPPKQQTLPVRKQNQKKVFYDEIFLNEAERSTTSCLKLQESVLDQHLNVTFSLTDIKAEQSEKSYINKLFKPSELVYTIRTEARNRYTGDGLEWVVRRKYADFEWLRSNLMKIYPGSVIPPLPKQPAPQNQSSLRSAHNKLKYFLQEVYSLRQLRNSKSFEIFLSMDNPIDFEVYKKKSQNLTRPKNLNSVLNMTGQVVCNYSFMLNGFSTFVQDFVAKQSQVLKKIKQISKQISLLHDSLALKYHQLAGICQQLKLITDDLMKQHNSDMPCMKKLSSTYDLIGKMTGDHSALIIRDKHRFEDFYRDYFSYEAIKIENILGLAQKRNQIATLYQKKYQSTQSLAGGMFTKLSTAVFGQKVQYLDCPSSNVQTLKQQFGFYNSRMYTQIVRFVQNQVSSYIEHFTSYGHQRINCIDQMQSYWSKFMVALSKLQAQSYLGRQAT